MSKLLKCIAFFCFCTIIIACEKDNIVNQNRHNFNGVYSIVSATADQAVDINFDGIAKTNLLDEISPLKYSYLELIIPEGVGNPVYSQFWPNQYFESEGEALPVDYDPTILVNYMNQATVASFIFKQDMSELTLFRQIPDPSFPLPKSVEILPNYQIKVVLDKKLYTRSGWKTTAVEVVYKRF